MCLREAIEILNAFLQSIRLRETKKKINKGRFLINFLNFIQKKINCLNKDVKFIITPKETHLFIYFWINKTLI